MMLFEREMAEHQAVAEATRQVLAAAFERMLAAWLACIRGGGRILVFGDDAGADVARHLARDLSGRGPIPRARDYAILLSLDASARNAARNGSRSGDVLAGQVKALGRPGDLAFGISILGEGPDVIPALQAARRLGLAAAGMSGAEAGHLAGLADPLLAVPSRHPARIHDMLAVLGRMLCTGLSEELERYGEESLSVGTLRQT
jgi:D-sedoheptulose 7-phosphate isomerase